MITTNNIVGFQKPFNLFVKKDNIAEFYMLSEKCGKKFKKIVRALKKNKDVDNPYALAKYIINKDESSSEDNDKSKLLTEYNFCGVYSDYLNDIYYTGSNGMVWGRTVTESKYDDVNSDYIDIYGLYYYIINTIVDKFGIKEKIVNTLTDKPDKGVNCSLLLLLGWSPETVNLISKMFTKYGDTLVNFAKDSINNGDYILFTNLDLFKDRFIDFIINTVKSGNIHNANLQTEADQKIARVLNVEDDENNKNTIATTSKLSNYIKVSSDFKFDIDKLYVLVDNNNDIKLITDNVRLVTLLKHFSDNINKVNLFIKTVDFLHNFRPLKEDESSK